MKTHFEEQVILMLECLTQIFPSNFFALKGGTAINFFFRDMPRLSVDIDLTYLPLGDRQSSIENIENKLKEIASNISRNIKDSKVMCATTPKESIHIDRNFTEEQYKKSTALLVEPGKVESLQKAILYVLEHGSESENPGMSARKLIFEKYTWTKHVEEIIKGFKKQSP